jgi:hypothetical protein
MRAPVRFASILDPRLGGGDDDRGERGVVVAPARDHGQQVPGRLLPFCFAWRIARSLFCARPATRADAVGALGTRPPPTARSPMHFGRTRLAYVAIAAFAIAAVACSSASDPKPGSGTGTGTGSQADAAPPQADAGTPDAPPNASALGTICSQTMACPAAAPSCLIQSAGATKGFCSLTCASGVKGTASAQGGLPGPTDQAGADAKCAAQFSGTQLTHCAVVLTGTVMPALGAGGPKPGTMYTYDMACAIACGANNSCPTGLTCNAQFQVCAP